jgi:hypothetical protein
MVDGPWSMVHLVNPLCLRVFVAFVYFVIFLIALKRFIWSDNF